ncbi:MAG: hypothetical protein JXM69_05840 [Anaerolineae bacterium]|nr:hypothetical protein [Anaerolineae bacterium]
MVYGGVEHDAGWALTISRSLVEYGTYTTTVSEIVDPAVPGGLNISKKFDIQAPDGRIWFRSSSVTGPASIVPDALALKLFGMGYWGFWAGPLIFYVLFLLLAAYILYRLAGLGAVILFHLFILFYPHLSIFLSYQALGEVPSIFYVLWAYLAFVWATQKQQRRWYHFFLAGLVAGLAVISKLITLLSLSGIFIWAGALYLINHPYVIRLQNFLGRVIPVQRFNVLTGTKSSDDPGKSIEKQKFHFRELSALAGGLGLVWSFWEVVQWFVLVRLTNYELYLQYLREKFSEFLDAGSGLRVRIYSGPDFFWDKFFRLQEIAHPQRWVTAIIFVAIFVGGMALIWLWRTQTRKQNLLVSLWLGWLVNMAWFVGLAKTGWLRHIWLGLILAVILLCIITVTLIKLGIGTGGHTQVGKENSQPKFSSTYHLTPFASGIFLLILIGWGFISQPYVWGFFLQDDLIPYWQEKQISDKYGAHLPWIIIPRAVQAEVIAYIDRLPPEAHVYYPAQHKAAEISALTGRIFYPLDRRQLMQPHAQDVAIIGPSLIAPWMDPVRCETLRSMVREECPQPVVANDYYMLCPFPAE